MLAYRKWVATGLSKYERPEQDINELRDMTRSLRRECINAGLIRVGEVFDWRECEMPESIAAAIAAL